jgi:3-hydroxyisobutyrate dehydrogenase
MATQASIGIVGIGAMGLPMARQLQRRGHAPLVRDIEPQAVAAAAAAGLVACGSAAELAARCDTILVVVVDAPQIDDVLFGAGGVVQAARAQTVVLCSTIGPDDTERCATRLAAHGIATLDAPISGGPARAADGTLSMMVAGDPAIVARCEPVLRLLASSLHGVGERVGDAARVKLVNNLLAGIHLAAGAEALALGTRLGLDPRLLLQVINASSGASWVVADRMARALAGDTEPRARTRILTKDIGLALRMAQDAGVATPIGQAALAVFDAAVRGGFGDADDASVITSRL